MLVRVVTAAGAPGRGHIRIVQEAGFSEVAARLARDSEDDSALQSRIGVAASAEALAAMKIVFASPSLPVPLRVNPAQSTVTPSKSKPCTWPLAP